MQITDMKAPFLTGKQIERAAQSVLDDYQRQWANIETAPVPVEDIMQFLGLSVEFDDFTRPDFFGDVGEEVLGFIKMEDKAVFVNQLLDPDDNPTAHVGRFHFTLAHEMGHYRLHKSLFEAYKHQITFIEDADTSKPAILCRHPDDDIGQKRHAMEIQADKFASYLLMPTNLIMRAWQERFGVDTPLTYENLVEPQYDLQAGASGDAALGYAIKPLADQLGVSMQAMRIRLEGLGLLTDGSQPQLL
jgi:Zn-dependent peptidase ImmA (M78 family)